MKALLTVAYLGTAYHGYQVQKNGVSVQEMLNRAALSVFGFDCDIVGCSRTDSGVHARGFVAAVTQKGSNALPTAIPVSRIPRAMNAHLPADISVLSAKEVPEDFHPRYDVVAKEYEYLFYDGSERDPVWEGRAFPVHPPLNETALAAMRAAAGCFVGKRDFSALRDKGADTKEEDSIREVFGVRVQRKGHLVSFRVRADGFLYHMVRIMAGTLLGAARGSISPEEIQAALAAGDRTRMGMTAPAMGLYLDRVFYSSDKKSGGLGHE